MVRGPSVKSCIKRFKAITITEIKTLSTRDLNNLMKLRELDSMIRLVLAERSMNEHNKVNNHVRESAIA